VRNRIIRQRRDWFFIAAVTICIPAAVLRAERVSYSFAGALTLSPYEPTLFGKTFPSPTLIEGSFAFNTDSPPEPGPSGPKSYKQSIAEGFTLKIGEQVLLLSADHFQIRVANDYKRQSNPQETVDTVDIKFDSADTTITPGPLMVNRAPWSSESHSFIVLELTYPPNTFTDASLPTMLPATYSKAPYSIVGSGSDSSQFQFFSVSSLSTITPPVGDYNTDGALGSSDYDEWRSAFGDTSVTAPFADGNGDGMVDGADYVVWRHAFEATHGGTGVTVTTVPEPARLILASVAAFALWLPLTRRRAHLVLNAE
jgi:hypothetical protein